jgi:conjugative transposon TraK protein
MENLIKHFDTIESGFRRWRTVTVCAVVLAVGVCALSLGYAYRALGSAAQRVYVLDNGQSFSASSADDAIQREWEVRNHLEQFHSYMFDLAPHAEAIEHGLEMALRYADRSAYDYWTTRGENQDFYNRLIADNVTEEIIVDSVKVDMGRYPRPAAVFGRVMLVRQSTVTENALVSTCTVRDTPRSPSNPAGLMIENFLVRKLEKTETRRRY